MKIVGENLRQMRQQKGYSQQYVADSLNVSVSTVSRMENNPAMINLEMYARIAQFYGIELRKIFSETESEIKEELAKLVLQVSIPSLFTSKFLFQLAKELERIEVQKIG